MSVNTKMTAIANEIRTLSGTTEAMGLDAMAAYVSEANAEISEQGALLTEIAALLSNKVVPPSVVLQTKTVMPDATTQIIQPDNGYDGLSAVTVHGDSNLVADNIAEGVSIFGVTGTHSGGGSVETCSIKVNYISSALVFDRVIYTIYENQECIVKTLCISEIAPGYTMGSVSFTIENVVCNSIVALCGEGLDYTCNCTINSGDLIIPYEYATMPCFYATSQNGGEITTKTTF